MFQSASKVPTHAMSRYVETSYLYKARYDIENINIYESKFEAAYTLLYGVGTVANSISFLNFILGCDAIQ